LEESVAEDHNALGRGFNLHRPIVDVESRRISVSFNVFEEGELELTVRDAGGVPVATLYHGRPKGTGTHQVEWSPREGGEGDLYFALESQRYVQLRRAWLSPIGR
jgi:hypothetical protein